MKKNSIIYKYNVEFINKIYTPKRETNQDRKWDIIIYYFNKLNMKIDASRLESE